MPDISKHEPRQITLGNTDEMVNYITYRVSKEKKKFYFLVLGVCIPLAVLAFMYFVKMYKKNITAYESVVAERIVLKKELKEVRDIGVNAKNLMEETKRASMNSTHKAELIEYISANLNKQLDDNEETFDKLFKENNEIKEKITTKLSILNETRMELDIEIKNLKEEILEVQEIKKQVNKAVNTLTNQKKMRIREDKRYKIMDFNLEIKAKSFGKFGNEYVKRFRVRLIDANGASIKPLYTQSKTDELYEGSIIEFEDDVNNISYKITIEQIETMFIEKDYAVLKIERIQNPK